MSVLSRRNFLMVVINSLAIGVLIWTLFVFFYQYIVAIGHGKGVITAFGNARILSALWLSFSSACVTAVLAVILGVPLGYFFAVKNFPGKTVVTTLAIDVPQTFPPVAEGIIFLLMLGPNSPFHVNIAYTFSALVLAKFFVSAPFVVALSMRKFLEIQNSGLDVIAQTLGAHPLQVFWTVYVPLALRDIIAGVAICWSRAMGELGGSMLFAGIIPFKTEIVPTFIAKAAEDSAMADQALAATILVTLLSAIALILFKTVATGSALWKVLFYKP